MALPLHLVERIAVAMGRLGPGVGTRARATGGERQRVGEEETGRRTGTLNL
jgi:hypothetical protein